jgi:hypothetical protein
VKIHETTEADGALRPVSLVAEEGALFLTSGHERVALPEGALAAVMARFGKPLDPSAELVHVDEVDLGEGCRLRHVRHLATYDVIARDWLVYEAPGEEALCALATNVAGALGHLARAFARV